MKKSTLITTIAMIVVVVVALSTATYAWFTGATKATAKGTINVVSSSDWLLAGSSKTLDNAAEKNSSANPDYGKDTVTFSYSTDIALTLPNGIYSPEGALTTTVSADTGSGITFQNNKWVQAEQQGITLTTSATIANGANTYDCGTTNVSHASYIKVKNGKSSTDPAPLQLTITVWTDATDDALITAAEQLCAYITWNDGTTAYKANTNYYYGTVGANDSASTGKATVSRGGGSNATTTAGTTVALAGGPGSNHANWVDCSTTALASTYTGESDNDQGQYYQYTLDLGDIAQNGEVTIAMYIWFDGWNIFTTQTGAAASVYLAFGDGPAN